MSAAKKYPARLSLSKLLARGWTRTMVRDFLGEPDARRPNPHGASRAPMRLYDKKRVEAAERAKGFAEAKGRNAERSARAKASAKARMDTLEAAVLRKVRIERISYKALRQSALRNQQAFYDGRAHYDGTSAYGADEATVQRWMVNFARHELSNYDEVREIYAGQVGVYQAAEAVRREVLRRIAAMWPELEDAVTQAQR